MWSTTILCVGVAVVVVVVVVAVAVAAVVVILGSGVSLDVVVGGAWVVNSGSGVIGYLDFPGFGNKMAEGVVKGVGGLFS